MRWLIQVFGRSGRGAGAAVDDRVEIVVDADLEAAGGDGAGEPAGHVEAVERQDAAALRLDPVEAGIVRRLGHREDAEGIGLEQDLGRDLEQQCRRGAAMRRSGNV